MNEREEWIALVQAIEHFRRSWRMVTVGDRSVNKSQVFTMVNLRYKGMNPFAGMENVDAYQPMTLSELSRAMGHSMPAVSQRISQLERLGYVKRTQDQTDKRTVWIQLTPEGHQLIVQVQNLFSKRLKQVMEQLGEDKILEIRQDLHCLAEAIEEVFHDGKENR